MKCILSDWASLVRPPHSFSLDSWVFSPTQRASSHASSYRQHHPQPHTPPSSPQAYVQICEKDPHRTASHPRHHPLIHNPLALFSYSSGRIQQQQTDKGAQRLLLDYTRLILSAPVRADKPQYCWAVTRGAGDMNNTGFMHEHTLNTHMGRCLPIWEARDLKV